MIFDQLYEADQRDRAILSAVPHEHRRSPARFSYGEWELIADIPKLQGGDGNPARVYECRMPARFFKVEVLDSQDSMGRPNKGFTLGTGSGDAMGLLCVQIALAATNGMIGYRE